MENKGFEITVKELMNLIDELKVEHLKIIDQVRICKDMSTKTENIDNQKLIVNDLATTLDHIVEKDIKMLNEFNVLLKSFLDLVVTDDKIKYVCCECGQELTQEELDFNNKNQLNGYCKEHRKLKV